MSAGHNFGKERLMSGAHKNDERTHALTNGIIRSFRLPISFLPRSFSTNTVLEFPSYVFKEGTRSSNAVHFVVQLCMKIVLEGQISAFSLL